MEQSRDDRSLGELFSELSRQTSTLVRQEVALAKSELSQTAGQVGKNVAFLAVGGAVVYAGVLAVLAAIIILLAEVLPWWLSALLVGIVVAAIGYFLIDRGRAQLKRAQLAPQQTMESLKENREWLKEQA
ncbi:MAG: phage holin family protein [Sphaerobacter sp.]|nr:phage holin family protein [Sphaerobacter sp.]